jgi:hypothetical protein
MTTPSDIITAAMQEAGVLGVGQTLSGEDTTTALNRLNWMLAQWQRKRWLVYHLVDVAAVSTGAQSYNVGTAQPLNVVRPDRIEAAYLRQLVNSQPIDYPLEELKSREDYNLVALKSLTSFPYYFFYDAAYPTGVFYPWPIPLASIYEIHITVKEQLGSFTNLAQQINLPPEYMGALHYNLAARLRAAYRLPPDPTLIGLARDALNVIRSANAQVPRLQMPTDLVRGGLWNVFGDNFY